MATETPTVRPGQVWADNDPRVSGRTLRVDSIDDTHATCTILTNDTATQARLDRRDRTAQDRRGKTTRIRLDRFKPTRTGYRLVRDAP